MPWPPCCLQAPLDSIKGTVNALGPHVELSQVFGGITAGAHYNLRWVHVLDTLLQPVASDVFGSGHRWSRLPDLQLVLVTIAAW